MQKKVILFANSTVIIMVALIVVSLFSLSALFAASGSTVLAPQVDVEATARAIQFNNHRAALEAASEARMAIKQAEIEQVQQALNSLDTLIQTQTIQYNEQRLQLQEQVDQEQVAIQQLEAQVIQLQQRIQADQTRFIQDLITLESQLANDKAELQTRIEAVSLDLATIEAQMALPPALSSDTSDQPASTRDDDGDRNDHNDDDNDSSDDSSDDDSDDKNDSGDRKDDKDDDGEDDK